MSEFGILQDLWSQLSMEAELGTQLSKSPENAFFFFFFFSVLNLHDSIL